MAVQLVARGRIYKLRAHQKIRLLCILATDIPPRATGEPSNINGRGPVP